MIVDEVTTLTGPGELIDVVVSDLGIAVNRKRQDLLDAIKGKDLPIRIEAIKAEVERICGGRLAKPKLGDRPVAVVGGRTPCSIPCSRCWKTTQRRQPTGRE